MDQVDALINLAVNFVVVIKFTPCRVVGVE
jgi:hypothetical protein